MYTLSISRIEAKRIQEVRLIENYTSIIYQELYIKASVLCISTLTCQFFHQGKKKTAQVLNMSVQCYKKQKTQQSIINCIIYQNS